MSGQARIHRDFLMTPLTGHRDLRKFGRVGHHKFRPAFRAVNKLTGTGFVNHDILLALEAVESDVVCCPLGGWWNSRTIRHRQRLLTAGAIDALPCQIFMDGDVLAAFMAIESNVHQLRSSLAVHPTARPGALAMFYNWPRQASLIRDSS